MQVIRYPWYAASLLGGAPHTLTWLRYTAFYALYPVGVVAEMWIIAAALPVLASTGIHSISLPNAWNWAFSYHYFMVVRPKGNPTWPLDQSLTQSYVLLVSP